MDKTVFLTLEEVLALHFDQINRYGGSHGIRDLNLLLSAISRPQVTFGGEDLYPDLFQKAAALIHSLTFNHPFVDGNKRTAIVSGARFLYLNDYKLAFSKGELVNLALDIESKTLNLDKLAVWLKKHSDKINF